MRLYDFERSGNCYKIRLFLSLLDIEYETQTIDLLSGDNFKPDFLKLNPRGQVPTLQDDGEVFWDSQAILVYLARRYADENWLPIDPVGLAEIMQWLAISENEILFGLARARAIRQFNRPGDLQDSQNIGESALKVINHHLNNNTWLACKRHTIADIACFPYIALAPEGDIPLDDYPHINAWMDRIKALPGFVGMTGIESQAASDQ